MSAPRKPSKHSENRLLVINNPNSPRLSPELAAEIGLNESILFLQLEFWIAISNNDRDGRKWCYKSSRDIESIFPFWSNSTVDRIVNSLVDKNLITVGNYNKHAHDKTRWFSINLIEAAKLESISVEGLEYIDLDLPQNGAACPKMGNGEVQNGACIPQNGATLPEYYTETKPEESTSPSFDVESIYEAYPRKANKAVALKAVVKAVERVARGGPRAEGQEQWPPVDPVAFLRERSEAFARSCQGKNPKYIPHAATWFNQERYLDVPEAPAASMPAMVDTYTRMQAMCSPFATTKGGVCH